MLRLFFASFFCDFYGTNIDDLENEFNFAGPA